MVESNEHAVARLMDSMGLDRTDEDLMDTPRRVSAMYAELLHGHYGGMWDRVDEHLESSFESDYDGIVSITDIDAVGVCPHHLLPVRYVVQVGYIPNGRMVGLSKIPRVVRLLAARPVLQEQFTKDIVTALGRIPQSQGTIALVRGHHSCMSIRGVKATNSDTITSSVSGVFASDASAKSEFLSLINQGAG